MVNRDSARAAPAAKTTTYGIVAHDAATAVILRRGPTRYTRLLLWNLRDHSISGGQWLRGYVEPRSCGVSPDGKLLIYEARKRGETFTAISRLPYFTALAFWAYSWPGGGGGFFTSNATVVLYVPVRDPRLGGAVPPGFEVMQHSSYLRSLFPTPFLLEDVVLPPEAHHGWSTTRGGVDKKPSSVNPRVRLERLSAGPAQRSYRVIEDARGRTPMRTWELGVLDWVDWSHDGELILGERGCLYRQPVPRSRLDAPADRVLVADLNGQSFERVVPPAAMCHWPEWLGRAKAPRGSGRG